MELVKSSTPHGRSSHQHPQSTESAMLQPPATASNLTSFDTLTPLAEPTSWLRTSSRLGYPFMISNQHPTDGALAQQAHFGSLLRDRSPYSSPINQTLPQAAVPNATVGGRQKRQSGRDEVPRPERKNTKRRKTGPGRFGNYLHGDVALPLDTTTADVFKKYPNHITDEDIVSSLYTLYSGSIFRISWFEMKNPEPASFALPEYFDNIATDAKITESGALSLTTGAEQEEYWRLGLSARQISELMPEDTHFNSDGVLIQQHHSMIQKKFKAFKLRHETRVQAMNDNAVQQSHQDLPRPSSGRESRTHSRQPRNSTAGSDAPPSTADEVVQVPGLKFRCYPFNPANDQAFEARVSVELAKIVPVSGRMAQEDYEIQVLDVLVSHEVQKHDDLLKRQFAQNQTFTSSTVPNVRSGTENRLYHRQLLSYIDHQRSALYTDISVDLLGQWGAPRFATTNTGTASEALRKLMLVIDQMYLRHSTNVAPPSAKRPLFNFEHTNLRRWRDLARLLYYLTSITLKLEAGTSAEDAGTPLASSLNLHITPRPLSETRARYRDQTMNLPDAGHGLLGGLPHRGKLMSTTSNFGPDTVAYQQSFNATDGRAAGDTSAIRPQASPYLASPSPSTTHVMPSISGMATIGHASASPTLSKMRSPYHSSIAANAIRDQVNQGDTRSASAGAAWEQASCGTYTGPFATSLLPSRTPHHPALLSSAMNLSIEPSVSPTRLPPALKPENVQKVPRDAPSETSTRLTDLEMDTDGVGLPQDSKQDALSPIRPPRTPTIATRSLQPDMPAIAYPQVSEIDDTGFFPAHGDESDDYTAEMFDWDEWDAATFSRTESSNPAN